MENCLNKFRYTHITEYYISIKKWRDLCTTKKELQDILVSKTKQEKRNQTKKVCTVCVACFHLCSKREVRIYVNVCLYMNKKSLEGCTRNQSRWVTRGGWGRKETGRIKDRNEREILHQIPFYRYNFLTLSVSPVHNTVAFLTTSKWCLRVGEVSSLYRRVFRICGLHMCNPGSNDGSISLAFVFLHLFP